MKNPVWSWKPDNMGFAQKAKHYINEAMEMFGRVYLLDIGLGDGKWTKEYSEDASLTWAIDTWKGMYSGCLQDAVNEHLKGRIGRDLLLMKATAKGMIPLRNESVHVVTNKDSTQDARVLNDVSRVLVPGGYYVRSGRINFWDVFPVILKVARERPGYFGDLKGRLPVSAITRAHRRLDPHCYFREVEESGLVMIDGEKALVPDCEPERVEAGMKTKCTEEDLKMRLRWNHMLGTNYDPEMHPEFLDELKRTLEMDPDGDYLVTDYASFLVARKP